MDGNNLINFNSNDCYKVASPLIPLPVDPQQKYKPRLSDVDNNPFDKVLRKTMRGTDPFDCVLEESFINCVNTSAEDKENVQLISPYMTPIVAKKKLKICNTPIYIGENVSGNTPKLRKEFDRLIPKEESRRNSLEDSNNSSLQFLNDSVLNDTLNFGFVNSEELDENASKNSLLIPEICVNDGEVKVETRTKNILTNNSENVISYNSDSLFSPDIYLNPSENPNRKIEKVTKSLSSTGDNLQSFISDSLNFDEISNIPASFSKSQTVFNKAFVDSMEKSGDFRRRCMSASRPQKSEFTFRNVAVNRQLNNSFAGFQFDERENSFDEKEFLKHDSVLLEEQKMKKRNDASCIQQALEAEDKLDASSPPWIEDNSILSSDTSDVEDDEVKKNKQKCDVKTVQLTQTNLKDDFEDTCVDEEINDINKNEIKMSENDVKAKCLLQNITDILQSDTNSVERKKLGESLFDTLALALNLDNSLSLNDRNENKVSKETEVVEKKAKSLKPKNKISCIKNLETKIKVQGTKITEKSLKVKSDKEKHARGPLKAIIPVKNMAKTKKYIVPKFSFGCSSSTPPKILKTSTPNERKLKSPVAQSTPNTYKPTFQSANTPTRSLSYLRSSLPRPSSTSDLNRSISPKNLGNTSGSCHNLGNSSGSCNVTDKPALRSIPVPGNCSMLRRKSASDLKENNNLQRSFDAGKVAKPSKLKRSSSFQKYLKT